MSRETWGVEELVFQFNSLLNRSGQTLVGNIFYCQLTMKPVMTGRRAQSLPNTFIVQGEKEGRLFRPVIRVPHILRDRIQVTTARAFRLSERWRLTGSKFIAIPSTSGRRSAAEG